jgi:hypothetical protein
MEAKRRQHGPCVPERVDAWPWQTLAGVVAKGLLCVMRTLFGLRGRPKGEGERVMGCLDEKISHQAEDRWQD